MEQQGKCLLLLLHRSTSISLFQHFKCSDKRCHSTTEARCEFKSDRNTWTRRYSGVFFLTFCLKCFSSEGIAKAKCVMVPAFTNVASYVFAKYMKKLVTDHVIQK